LAHVMAEARASYAFVERNFNLVKRYFNWEVVFLFYNIINTLTIGLIGVGQDERTVLYLVIGALLWGYLSVIFFEVSQSISWERWEGTIEYTFMAPVRRLTHLLGMCLFAIAYGVIRTAIVLVAVVLFFDLSLKGANLFGALLMLLVSSVSFIGLGLVTAVLPLMSPERGSQGAHIVQGIILLVSGVYYDISVLPAWLRPLAYISPATYTLEGARLALLDGVGTLALWPYVLKVLVIGVVSIPLGLAIFSWGERHAMRTGKLKRSG